MQRSFRRMAPLWMSYIILFALAALGPILGQYGGLSRGHWTFLFLMPFAIGCVPYSFIMGEIVQHRTRLSGRSSWRWGFFHMVVMYAIFIVGIFDTLFTTTELVWYAVWLIPAFASGIFLVFGMAVMRMEQAHSDARYGVEVSRGDPWASFFDLEWEDDSPRTMTAPSAQDRGSKPKRKSARRGWGKSSSSDAPMDEDEVAD